MVKAAEKTKKLTEKEKIAKAAKLEKEKAAKQKALEKEKAAKKAEKEKAAKQKALEKEKAAKQKALEKEKAAKQKALEKAAKQKALEKVKTKPKVVKVKKEPKAVKTKREPKEKQKGDKSKLLHLVAHAGNVTYNHRLKEGTPVIDIHDLSKTTSKKKKTTFITGLAASTLGLNATSSTELLEKAKENFSGLLNPETTSENENADMMDEDDKSQLE
jgi:hypothetical protein